MTFNECEQLRIDNDWSLTRANACHISVMNDEMGILVKSQIDIQASLGVIELKVNLIFAIMGIAAATLIALVIKKMWGKS